MITSLLRYYYVNMMSSSQMRRQDFVVVTRGYHRPLSPRPPNLRVSVRRRPRLSGKRAQLKIEFIIAHYYIVTVPRTCGWACAAPRLSGNRRELLLRMISNSLLHIVTLLQSPEPAGGHAPPPQTVREASRISNSRESCPKEFPTLPPPPYISRRERARERERERQRQTDREREFGIDSHDRLLGPVHFPRSPRAVREPNRRTALPVASRIPHCEEEYRIVKKNTAS